jgi:hypothetical protein
MTLKIEIFVAETHRNQVDAISMDDLHFIITKRIVQCWQNNLNSKISYKVTKQSSNIISAIQMNMLRTRSAVIIPNMRPFRIHKTEYIIFDSQRIQDKRNIGSFWQNKHSGSIWYLLEILTKIYGKSHGCINVIASQIRCLLMQLNWMLRIFSTIYITHV